MSKLKQLDLLIASKSTIEAINNAKEKTANNTGLKLIFAINYGGRAELVHSIKNMLTSFINKVD